MTATPDQVIAQIRARVGTAEEVEEIAAIIESLKENLARLTSNPADQRYWEGRCRDAEAERDALRKALAPFAALIERSDTMDIEWLEANAPGTELEAYSPSSDKLVSSGEMRNPIFVTRGDFRRARTLSGDKS